ncbi:MAG: hypothetical protein ACLFRV_10125 [Acidimicrobiales bacterium]
MAPDDTTTVRVRPAPWYLATIVATTVAVTALILLVIDAGSGHVLIGAPIGVAIATHFTMTLHLSPTGVRLASSGEAPWEHLELTSGRFGETLRTTPGTARRRRDRVAVFLPTFESNWRDGAIGDHIRRYAPHLLEEPPRADSG